MLYRKSIKPGVLNQGNSPRRNLVWQCIINMSTLHHGDTPLKKKN